MFLILRNIGTFVHHAFDQIIRVTIAVWMHMIWLVHAVTLGVYLLAANPLISNHQKTKRKVREKMVPFI